jgi:eukaryotic-like serine/threonine-protein kinase
MNSSLPSARLRPFRPQPFGRYTLLSHLATGGMGEIYLARLEGAQGFEKLCVIKRILPQLAADTEFVERFVGEARILVKLSHGSIAQVLDMGLHEGDAYMALEYVDGKDLRKVAGRVRDRQSPLPLTFVLYVMTRVLDALAYAHRKRDDDEKEIHLVHRDISPQNILISYEGEVKVIDFGLAKSRLSAAKTNPSIILGKFLYMSPEQARHQQVDRRSDLYAVGLCLYELLSGKNPFDSVSPGELMTAVAQPRIAPLSEVEPMTPPQVAQVVMKALAVDPAQRFQSAEEFRGKLTGCLQEIDPQAGPESVSRFMRELFAVEYQGERKLLAQLKDVPRMAEPVVRPAIPADPALARVPNPALPPRTIRLDGPVEPLSFQPTPRNRDGAPVDEGETRPGVMLDESTRPGVYIEELDEAAAERPPPPVEPRNGPPPPPPPEIEAVVPVTGPGSTPPVFSPPLAARASEPLRPAIPPATSGPQLRPAEPVRASAPVPPAARPPAAAPAAPAYVPLALEVSRSMMAQAPARPPLPEEAPTVPEAAPAAPSYEEFAAEEFAAPFTPPPVPPPPRPPVAAASSELSRRGMDDTHPSYQMLAPAQHEDTHPRVVLDEAAFQADMEEAPPVRPSASSEEEAPAPPVRPRTSTAQRARVSTTGMPTVSRSAGPRSGSMRTVSAELPLRDEGAGRDPRDETRRTAAPAPGDAPRRMHREDTRRTARAPRPRTSSWGRLAVGLGLPLLVIGAVLVAFPRLKPLLQDALQEPVRPPPAPVPLSPARSASAPKPVPPPEAAALKEAEAHEVPPASPAPSPSPPEPSLAAGHGPQAADAPAPPAANPGLTAVEVAESEMFVPLTPEPSEAASPAAKKPPRNAVPAKRGTRKELSELQRDWNSARNAFSRLTHEHSCDSPRIGLLCNRFEILQNDVLKLGDAYDRRLHDRVREMRKSLQQAAD